MLIPCSRSAHDQNVLARRPQWDQHRFHSWESETSKLGRTIVSYSLQPCFGQGVSLGEVAWQRLLVGGGEGFNLG